MYSSLSLVLLFVEFSRFFSEVCVRYKFVELREKTSLPCRVLPEDFFNVFSCFGSSERNEQQIKVFCGLNTVLIYVLAKQHWKAAAAAHRVLCSAADPKDAGSIPATAVSF